MVETPYLVMKHMRKSFEGNPALVDASLSVCRGEILAIVGENGSGKTTLMNILGGVYKPGGGEISVGGEPVSIDSTQKALELKIYTVFQRDSLFENLNVAQNIFINSEPKTRLGYIDWKSIYHDTAGVLQKIGLAVRPDAHVSELTIAERKMVEMARAIVGGARIVILDEPTAAFVEEETEKLFDILRGLRNSGVAVIYISHRLQEIPRIADRIMVIRDGVDVAHMTCEEFSKVRILDIIAGEHVKDRYPKIYVEPGEDVLLVSHLTNQYLHDISFSLKKGEILGVTGLKGSGKTSLARALFGLDPVEPGSIYMDGKRLISKNTQNAVNSGISFVPADRFDKGLALCASVANNTVITNLEHLIKTIFISNRKKRQTVAEYKEMLGIRYHSELEQVQNLSGGNQKKVMLSKWILRNTKVMIMNEPTSSMDIASKVDIYNCINEMVLKGVGIILISTEIPELLGMCDRIIVLRKARIVATFDRRHATQELVMDAALGIAPAESSAGM